MFKNNAAEPEHCQLPIHFQLNISKMRNPIKRTFIPMLVQVLPNASNIIAGHKYLR